MQGVAPNTSYESVQIVTVVKPSETLENAFNVLPEDNSRNAKWRNGTIMIDLKWAFEAGSGPPWTNLDFRVDQIWSTLDHFWSTLK